MDQSYHETLIAAADDSPAEHSTVPRGRGARKTVAEVQYEMLAGHPFECTHEHVLLDSWLQRQDLGDLSDDETAEVRREFFAKPQPCLRPSPLPKKYGWGLIFGAEADDKLALTPVGRTSTGRRWREGSSSSSRRCARAARRKMQRARRERAGVAAR